ncbi:conserved hypothetical protein [Beggiatoa sp. SS]|nr:conserved hypothetical protein [Beggiatoa sp. SS]
MPVEEIVEGLKHGVHKVKIDNDLRYELQKVPSVNC